MIYITIHPSSPLIQGALTAVGGAAPHQGAATLSRPKISTKEKPVTHRADTTAFDDPSRARCDVNHQS